MSIAKKRPSNKNDSTIEPANKKQKLNDVELLLYQEQFADIDSSRTLSELDNIPSHWNQFCKHWGLELTKQDILQYKFHIASATKNTTNYGERWYCYIDKSNNICIITDAYDNKNGGLPTLNNLMNSKENKITFEAYHNPNIKHFYYYVHDRFRKTFEVHRGYIGIMRIPLQCFTQNYIGSFQQFVIEERIRFFALLEKYNYHDKKYYFIDGFQTFFEKHAGPDKQRSLSTKYHHLFDAYCSSNTFQFTQPFILLFEKWDKPWLKQSAVEKYIESEITKTMNKDIACVVIGYLHYNCEELDYLKWVEQVLQLNDTEEDEAIAESFEYKCGQYTSVYEWSYFRRSSEFLTNPFKYKYLNVYQQNRVNGYWICRMMNYYKRYEKTKADHEKAAEFMLNLWATGDASYWPTYKTLWGFQFDSFFKACAGHAV